MITAGLILMMAQIPEVSVIGRFREIVVREVYPAGHPSDSQETTYFLSSPLGDHDRNSQMDFMLAGLGIDSNRSDAELVRIQSGLQIGYRDWYHSGFGSKFYPQGGIGPEGLILALLSTTSAPRVAILDLSVNLTVWDLPSRRFVGTVPIPPPPVAGLPGVGVFRSVLGDSDVNGDGWSDLFFQDVNGGYGLSGLVNGRTLQTVWQGLTDPPVYRSIPIVNDHVGGRPDLNGDGNSDFLAGFEKNDHSTRQVWHAITAYSGFDGSVLWTSDLDGFPGWACYGLDWTGDGVPDVAQGTSQFLAGLDGATGRKIWIQSTSTLATRIPPQFDWHLLDLPAWVQPAPPAAAGAPTGAEVWNRITLMQNHGQLEDTGFIVLDAQDGSIREFVMHPSSLRPWRDYSLAGYRDFNRFTPLGDVDRDGLKEFGNPMYGIDINDPNNPNEPHHYVIYGQRTLITPDEAAPGEEVSLPVWIPSAPGHEVYLLASDTFEGEAGFDLDGWRTRLGPGALLTASLAARPGRTLLDGQGLGTIRFRIPNLPNLAGKKLYLRAIVEQPGAVGKVWTISSVGEIRIL